MSIAVLLILSAGILVAAYFTYGNRIARLLHISDSNATPANTLADGIDYEPTPWTVVLGHHFASIAGAGPIVGPVLAVSFGWIPAILWILFGGIFFGAVQDITSLVISLRHQGKSIGSIVEAYLGKRGKFWFLVFSFATLILVIAVFTDIVAKTFVAVPSTASSSAFFVILAMVFGLGKRRFPGSFVSLGILAIVLTFAMIPLGMHFPVSFSYPFWVMALLVYVFFAAVSPIWLLLQPRDFLNAFLLFALMIAGLFGAFVSNPAIEMSAAVNWNPENLGFIFPVLFITVACGAISGFHSLVASGTTAKQIRVESDAKKVGYGGMLLESFLAVLAVTTVLGLSRESFTVQLSAQGPIALFSSGIAAFLSALHLPVEIGKTFVALTVSAFAITSLDTCTRLARFALQELFAGEHHPVLKHVAENRFSASTIPVLLSFFFLSSGGFSQLWPLFGSANQLLGALALLAVTVWLQKSGKKFGFTLVPMVFMFTVTISSLVLMVWSNAQKAHWGLAGSSLVLVMLSLVLLQMGVEALKKKQ